jgi:hypothetical protein
MPNNHPSDFKRNLRREIAGYFLVVLCALPVRFWIYSTVKEQEGWVAFLAEKTFAYLSIGLIGAVVASKLRLRYKLALTFVLVAI